MAGFVKNKYWVSKHVGCIAWGMGIVGGEIASAAKALGKESAWKRREKGEGKIMEEGMGIKMGVLGASV